MYFDYPENYSIYSIWHIRQVLLVFSVLAAIFFVFRNKKKALVPMMITVMSVCWACVIGITIFSIITNVVNLEWTIPLHICNLFTLVYPVMLIFKGKVRTFLMEYAFYFGFSGCVAYTLFPATTHTYFHALHLVPMLTMLFHLAIGSFAVFAYTSKEFVPAMRNIWKPMAIFLPLAGVSFLANYFLQTNFSFMNPSVAPEVYQYIAFIFGPYYPYVVLGIVIVIASTLLIIDKLVRRHRQNQEDC